MSTKTAYSDRAKKSWETRRAKARTAMARERALKSWETRRAKRVIELDLQKQSVSAPDVILQTRDRIAQLLGVTPARVTVEVKIV